MTISRNHIDDNSKKVIRKYDFTFLQSFLDYFRSSGSKMCTYHPGIKLLLAVRRFGRKNYWKLLHTVHTTARQVVDWKRMAEKYTKKLKNAHVKPAKTTVFLACSNKNIQIWEVWSCCLGAWLLKLAVVVIKYTFFIFFNRIHDHNPPTYETGSTRKFLLGRTDTIRSASIASSNFVKAMVSPNKTVSFGRLFSYQ